MIDEAFKTLKVARKLASLTPEHDRGRPLGSSLNLLYWKTEQPSILTHFFEIPAHTI
jgi:hypothetical protein